MRNNRGGRMRRVLATTARIGRPQASMIVAIVALVFAATGGAIASTQGHPAKLRHGPRAGAASGDSKTDAKQISAFFKSHRASLRGPPGAPAATGSTGPAAAKGHDGAPS